MRGTGGCRGQGGRHHVTVRRHDTRGRVDQQVTGSWRRQHVVRLRHHDAQHDPRGGTPTQPTAHRHTITHAGSTGTRPSTSTAPHAEGRPTRIPLADGTPTHETHGVGRHVHDYHTRAVAPHDDTTSRPSRTRVTTTRRHARPSPSRRSIRHDATTQHARPDRAGATSRHDHIPHHQRRRSQLQP